MDLAMKAWEGNTSQGLQNAAVLSEDKEKRLQLKGDQMGVL